MLKSITQEFENDCSCDESMAKHTSWGIGGCADLFYSPKNIIVGFDLNDDLMDERKFEKYRNLNTSFIHVTIPVTDKYINNVLQLQ